MKTRMEIITKTKKEYKNGDKKRKSKHGADDKEKSGKRVEDKEETTGMERKIMTEKKT